MPEFDKENQPKERKPRGQGKKVLMLDAIRSVCKDEIEFLEKVVTTAMGDPLAEPVVPPNAQLLTLVLQRIEAPLKSTSPLVNFDFPEKGTPAERAFSIMDAISNGVLPVDIGQSLIAVIKDAVVIEESTDMKADLEDIKKSLGLD